MSSGAVLYLQDTREYDPGHNAGQKVADGGDDELAPFLWMCMLREEDVKMFEVEDEDEEENNYRVYAVVKKQHAILNLHTSLINMNNRFAPAGTEEGGSESSFKDHVAVMVDALMASPRRFVVIDFGEVWEAEDYVRDEVGAVIRGIKVGELHRHFDDGRTAPGAGSLFQMLYELFVVLGWGWDAMRRQAAYVQYAENRALIRLPAVGAKLVCDQGKSSGSGSSSALLARNGLDLYGQSRCCAGYPQDWAETNPESKGASDEQVEEQDEHE